MTNESLYFNWIQLTGHTVTGGLYLKTDGTSLPQLVAKSSPWWRDGADDRTASQQLLPINESLVVGAGAVGEVHPRVTLTLILTLNPKPNPNPRVNFSDSAVGAMGQT